MDTRARLGIAAAVAITTAIPVFMLTGGPASAAETFAPKTHGVCAFSYDWVGTTATVSAHGEYDVCDNPLYLDMVQWNITTADLYPQTRLAEQPVTLAGPGSVVLTAALADCEQIDLYGSFTAPIKAPETLTGSSEPSLLDTVIYGTGGNTFAVGDRASCATPTPPPTATPTPTDTPTPTATETAPVSPEPGPTETAPTDEPTGPAPASGSATPAATTVATATDTAVAVASNNRLAYTGSTPGPYLAAALAALITGGLFMLWSARRRQTNRKKPIE